MLLSFSGGSSFARLLGNDTSGDNRKARLRAGPSHNPRGRTSCLSMTDLHPVTKSRVKRIGSIEGVVVSRLTFTLYNLRPGVRSSRSLINSRTSTGFNASKARIVLRGDR